MGVYYEVKPQTAREVADFLEAQDKPAWKEVAEALRQLANGDIRAIEAVSDTDDTQKVFTPPLF